MGQKAKGETQMRQAMVTRTMLTTKCNVLCIDVAKKEPFTKEVIVPKTFKDEAKLFKAVEKIVNDGLVKAVNIERCEVVTTLYGMDETFFIQNATVLPPRKA